MYFIQYEKARFVDARKILFIVLNDDLPISFWLGTEEHEEFTVSEEFRESFLSNLQKLNDSQELPC